MLTIDWIWIHWRCFQILRQSIRFQLSNDNESMRWISSHRFSISVPPPPLLLLLVVFSVSVDPITWIFFHGIASSEFSVPCSCITLWKMWIIWLEFWIENWKMATPLACKRPMINLGVYVFDYLIAIMLIISIYCLEFSVPCSCITLWKMWIIWLEFWIENWKMATPLACKRPMINLGVYVFDYLIAIMLIISIYCLEFSIPCSCRIFRFIGISALRFEVKVEEKWEGNELLWGWRWAPFQMVFSRYAALFS